MTAADVIGTRTCCKARSSSSLGLRSAPKPGEAGSADGWGGEGSEQAAPGCGHMRSTGVRFRGGVGDGREGECAGDKGGALQIRGTGGIAQCVPRKCALLLQGKRRQTGVVRPFVGGLRIGGGTGSDDGHVTADSELFASCRKVPAKLSSAVPQQLGHMRQH
jgi:hypothetical protein